MSKHILVISQYYYPENFRINDITKEWINKGYKVTVVTGIPNYPKGKFFKGYGFFRKRIETIDGINVIRLALIPRLKNNFFLVLNYISFVISGWFWSKMTRVKADLVYIYEVSPMTQALPGIWYAQRRDIPCYLYVTDLWPESVLFATNIKNKFIVDRIQKMVDKIYQKVSKILISSRGFHSPILGRNVAYDKIQYWPQYPEEIYKPTEQLEFSDYLPNDSVFNITYAGNIGYAQGFSTLVKAAIILKQKFVKVRFNIIGEGRYKTDLLLLINKSNVTDYFNFIGRKPPTDIPQYLSVSDAALIILDSSKVFSYTLPSKIQTYLSCAVPIIGSANGELQRLIIESNSGFCSEAGNAEELANNISKMIDLGKDDLKKMGWNGRNYCIENFDKNQLLEQLDNLFNEITIGEDKNV